MSIESKLRDGSQAIKQATRQAEFTSRSPADRRGPQNGPMLAWIGGLAVIALLGIPAVIAGVGGQPSVGPKAGAAPTTANHPTVSTGQSPKGIPYLTLDLPDTTVEDAFEIADQATGERVGVHTVYRQTRAATNEERADGRLAPPQPGSTILIRIQKPGTEFLEFDHYAALAERTEIVEVDGREVTIYLVPDEAIEEGSYDLGILRWTEGPGYEVILIPWGQDDSEALALMDGLTPITESQWEELGSFTDQAATTTTIVDSETPTTDAVDAPENPAPDGP